MDNCYPFYKYQLSILEIEKDRRRSMMYVVPSVVLLFTLIGIFQKKVRIGALGVVVLLYMFALVFEVIF